VETAQLKPTQLDCIDKRRDGEQRALGTRLARIRRRYWLLVAGNTGLLKNAAQCTGYIRRYTHSENLSQDANLCTNVAVDSIRLGRHLCDPCLRASC